MQINFGSSSISLSMADIGRDRHDDVRFRGKPLPSLTHEETLEALRQALSQIKHLTGHMSFFDQVEIGNPFHKPTY